MHFQALFVLIIQLLGSIFVIINQVFGKNMQQSFFDYKSFVINGYS